MSKRFTLNKQDIKDWLKNALIFAGPALIVLLGSIQGSIPENAKYGAIALYLVNLATDLLRKYLAGK